MNACWTCLDVLDVLTVKIGIQLLNKIFLAGLEIINPSGENK